jgi:CHASE3 domain sensor protein
MRNFFNRNGIRIAIAAIFILIVLGATLTYYNRNIMKESLEVKQTTVDVDKRVEKVFDNVQRMDISARGYALIRKPEFLFHPVEVARKEAKATFAELDTLFKKQGYQNPKHFDEIKRGIANYLDAYQKMVNHLHNNEMDEYLAMLATDYGKIVHAKFVPFQTATNQFEEEVLKKATRDYEAAVQRNEIVQYLLVLLGLPTLIWILYKLGKDERGRISLLLDLDRNNKQYLFNDGSDSTREAKSILSNSIVNLQRASNFVTGISEGNYEVKWEGLMIMPT